MNLQDLGWNAHFADAFQPYAEQDLIPARVVARHHGPCELLSEHGPLGGVTAGRMDEDALPVVGDWVAVRPLEGERKALIVAVLPRRGAFTRKEAWRRAVAQVVAANVDTAFLVTAFGHDLNPRRLERYLTAAWDSGADPVIVVNKLDLAEDPADELALVESVAVGVPVYAVSSKSGEGFDELDAQLHPGRTIALLGSSGVGKSTLLNRLLGQERQSTGETSGDGRGRHTTTKRELVPLPSGALLIDTPGMRELALWADEESLDVTFAEIPQLAAQCRFTDCAHDREPGCAVRAALADGGLEPARYESYCKLQRELRALELRRDNRLRSESRKEVRRLSRSLRRESY